MKQKEVKTKRAAAINFSEVFKRQVIEEYLQGSSSKIKLQEKYGIRFKSAIATWMKILGYVDVNRINPKLGVINPVELAKKRVIQQPEPLAALETELKLLKRQLEDERLRSELYNRMIDMAEKEYKIPIRKNSNTK